MGEEMLVFNGEQGFHQQVRQLFPAQDDSVFVFDRMEAADPGRVDPGQVQRRAGAGAGQSRYAFSRETD